MLAKLGFFCIFSSLIILIIEFIYGFYSLKHQDRQNDIKKLLLYFNFLSFLLSLTAFFILILAYIISDFSISNVYLNSHKLKPLIYKISGSWGNHEGSLLLLVNILNLYNLVFSYGAANKEKNISILIQTLISILFTSFLFFTSNPFIVTFPISKEGLGLNPILQDIGLIIHPPILYIGYMGLSIVFSLTIAHMITNKINQKFFFELRKWLFFSFGFLTLGIGLGSWWAYRELGWGGYWFWDPVENVSLMPWLCSIALLHSLIIAYRKNSFKLWICFLSSLNFILCLLGIFLVRSGLLTSVHSFANDPTRGIFIICILLIIGSIGFLTLAIYSKNRESNILEFNFFSKAGSILVNNFFILFALFIVALGTLYPLFSEILFDYSITIGGNYYVQLIAPLSLLSLFMMAVMPYLKFSKSNLRKRYKYLLLIIIFILLISIFFVFLSEEKQMLSYLILILCIFSIVSTLFKIIYKKLPKKNTLSTFFHIGTSLLFMAISTNYLFSDFSQLNMKIGDKAKINNYEIILKDIKYNSGDNYVSKIGLFSVKNKNNETSFLYPEMRYYKITNQITIESDIKHIFMNNLYIIIGQGEGKYHGVRIYYQPFVSFIWISVLIIFFSSIYISFRQKNM